MDIAINNRRDFIFKAGSAIGLGVLGLGFSSLVNSCEKSQTTNVNPVNVEIKIADYPELASVDSARTVTLTGTSAVMPVIIIRESATEFLVLLTKCSHLGCQVGDANMATKRITCPCHGSVYSTIDGTVIQGPAPKALQRYSSTFNAATNILTITV